MNSITNQPPPPSSFTCDRHLNHNFTAFCSSCLFERLNILDHSSTASSLPDLRRTKSYSASKTHNLKFEPQRKSCDVRARNTLMSLFSIDDQKNLQFEQQVSNVDEIRVSEEEEEIKILNELENDIVEMEAKIDQIVDNLKSVKDHIDFDSHSKKPFFWSTASVLTKKWQNWRRKQNKKTVVGTNDDYTLLPVEKPISQQYLETQSEIADYGYGRRSCDIDPRFSLDAGRVSFDDPPRYSFDQPRASWDGYLVGRPVVKIPRPDMRIPLEEHEPGGSTQTREYYLNSSSRRRKGLDRSRSIRKIAAPDIDDDRNAAPSVSNAKVSPCNHIHGRSRFHSIGSENELQRDSNSNYLRDDGSDSFDKEGKKKSWWWNWKQWGFSNRQNANRGGERVESGELRRGVNRKVDRINSSNVSWRSSTSYNMKKSNSIENGKSRQQEGDEYVFERNRSARHPPNNVNNGLLRFYLTPLRGSRRSGIAKSRLASNSNSMTRNMLRLY